MLIFLWALINFFCKQMYFYSIQTFFDQKYKIKNWNELEQIGLFWVLIWWWWKNVDCHGCLDIICKNSITTCNYSGLIGMMLKCVLSVVLTAIILKWVFLEGLLSYRRRIFTQFEQKIDFY